MNGTSWPLAWRLARREIAAGLIGSGFRGFRVFILSLAIGVAAIAGIGTLSASVSAGLRAEGANLLGGDIDIRLHNRPPTAAQDAWLAAHARVRSRMIEMRAMARVADGDAGADGARHRQMVEMKAVDGAYPLLGSVGLDPMIDVRRALGPDGRGGYGAAADANLLTRLGISLGDRIAVGAATFTVNAVIRHEPDRVASVLSLGPRLLVSLVALEASGLLQPGTQAHFHTRMLLPERAVSGEWRAALDAAFPAAGWRVRAPDEAAPGVDRFIQRMTLFLGFVGLTALLVGGIGVSNAVGGYLEGKTATIATLKCLGAPGALVFRIYFLQVMVLAGLGIGIGLIVGGGLPPLVLSQLGGALPVAPRGGFYFGPLALAALFGLLTAATFQLWPLGRAQAIPPAVLFRALIQPAGLRPPRAVKAAALAGLAGLAGLTFWTSSDRTFALWFIGGTIVTLGLLRFGAAALMALTRGLRRPRSNTLRLALSSIHRPGSNTPGVVLSLGIGLSVLVAVALIQGNIRHQLDQRLPEEAPAFFFIDIQPDQAAAFDAVVGATPGVGRLKRMPSLRGRIVRIAGVPVAEAAVAQDAQWAINGDRALTSSALPTEGSKIVAGQWWPADYAGPPLISLDAGLARGFGIGLGDTLTLNVLGRDITGTIASLREIDWRSLRFDFAIIFTPGPLEGAPHTHIAAVTAPPDIEDALENAVVGRFANITAIRVRDALRAASGMLESIGLAIGATSAITILAGALVLAGAIAAGERRRVYASVVFKVLGATRRDLLAAYAAEFAVLGLGTAVAAAAIGTLTAWAVIVFLMKSDWVFLPGVVAGTVAGALIVTVIAGFAGTWSALGGKAGLYLRNE